MSTYEAIPRHSEIIVKEFGLENAKPLSSPIAKMDAEEEGE